MKQRILLVFLFLLPLLSNGQGKKVIVKYTIKSVTETITEDGNTIKDSKKVFDKNGEVIEETNYDKEGAVKNIKRNTFDKDGNKIEESTYNDENQLVEKQVNKFNADGEKTEEAIYKNNKLVKKHSYTYNNKGLKTERKTTDDAGKTTSVHHYIYN
jgi:uncharacterized protein YkuJ